MSRNLDVKEVLKAAGWYEGRKIDTTEIVKLYHKYGYEVFPKALPFIEEFGNLEVITKETYKLKEIGEYEERHHTCPQEVLCEYYKHGSFKSEERHAQERLIPIGEACNEYLILFVSESGKFYHSTGKIGDTPWEAWESLINHSGLIDWYTLERERKELSDK